MEKKRKIIQVYAVIVNIVAIITIIISAASLISAIIDRNDPLYAGYNNNADLSSFEKYKLDVLSSTQKDAAFIPTDDAILEMYDAAKTDWINRINHQTYRTITVSTVIIVLSITLFGFHWWLAKKYG
jgi:hypothetical protein